MMEIYSAYNHHLSLAHYTHSLVYCLLDVVIILVPTAGNLPPTRLCDGTTGHGTLPISGVG